MIYNPNTNWQVCFEISKNDLRPWPRRRISSFKDSNLQMIIVQANWNKKSKQTTTRWKCSQTTELNDEEVPGKLSFHLIPTLIQLIWMTLPENWLWLCNWCNSLLRQWKSIEYWFLSITLLQSCTSRVKKLASRYVVRNLACIWSSHIDPFRLPACWC